MIIFPINETCKPKKMGNAYARMVNNEVVDLKYTGGGDRNWNNAVRGETQRLTIDSVDYIFGVVISETEFEVNQ